VKLLWQTIKLAGPGVPTHSIEQKWKFHGPGSRKSRLTARYQYATLTPSSFDA